MRHSGHNTRFLCIVVLCVVISGVGFFSYSYFFSGDDGVQVVQPDLEVVEQWKPLPNAAAEEEFVLSAGAALSVFIGEDGTEHILAEKHKEKQMPIASITKLITALVASDVFDVSEAVLVSPASVQGKGVSGKVFVGEQFSFDDALHALLIESNNDIARALADAADTKLYTYLFIHSMNERARELRLFNTRFVNPTGLDPWSDTKPVNRSTPHDVVRLLRYVFENSPDIFSITAKREYTMTELETGRIVHMETTNELLADSDLPVQVLGGKTGTTPKAKSNLVIVSTAPSQRGHIISVVLGSEDSFTDMRTLLHYVEDAHIW